MTRVFPTLLAGVIFFISASASACMGPFPPVYSPPPYIDPMYRFLAGQDVVYGPLTKFKMLMRDYAPSFSRALEQHFNSDFSAGISEDALRAYNSEVVRLLASKNIKDEGLALSSKDITFDCTEEVVGGYASFLRAVFEDPSVTDGYALFVRARQQIPEGCAKASSGSADEDIGALKQRRGVGLYPLYLEAAKAFHQKKYEAAFELFKQVAEKAPTKPSSWLHQTALYMLGRIKLIQAQASWDGYWEPAKKVDQKVLEEAKKTFGSYVIRYPNGVFADSAKNLQRKMMFLSGEQSGLNDVLSQHLNTALARLPFLSEDELANGVAAFFEYRNHHVGDPDAEKDSPFALAYKVFTAEPIQVRYPDGADVQKENAANEWWTKAMPLLEKRRSGSDAELEVLRFIRAYILFRQQQHDKVLELLASDEPLKNTTVSLSAEVLRARALAAKKDVKAAVAAWKRVAFMAHDDQSQIQIAALLAGAGEFDKLFGKDSGITRQEILSDFALFSATEKDLREVLGKTALLVETRGTIEQALFRKLLLRRDYMGMAALYKEARTPLPTEIKGAVEVLARKPNDPASLVSVGAYMYRHYIRPQSSTYRELGHFDSDALSELSVACISCRKHFENKSYVLPISDFIKAASHFEKTKETSDTEAEALHYLVKCYKEGEAINRCQWDSSNDNQSKKWFSLLHRKYPKSSWAKETPYYY